MTKKIAVLGSTGSIGKQTLEVALHLGKSIQVTGLCAHSNIDLLEEQILRFSPKIAAVTDNDQCKILAKRLKGRTSTEIIAGPQGAVKVAAMPEADMVVAAMMGYAGLKPVMAAIQAKKDVALANKETLVMAGELIMQAAAEFGVRLIPVDSEHSAIFQCLQGEKREALKQIYLTASGGPFRGMTTKQLQDVTVEKALAHPNWSMGAKITIDSATMMNKGLEVIEAMWLFGLTLEQVTVLVHPQSLVHSMVEFVDGQIMAQLGPADMRLPIQYALTYPLRESGGFSELNLLQSKTLTFEPPNEEVFPCLTLAKRAATAGGTMPAVMNAANEMAVDYFLNKEINFLQIPAIIEKAMDAYTVKCICNIEDVLNADSWARLFVKGLVKGE